MGEQEPVLRALGIISRQNEQILSELAAIRAEQTRLATTDKEHEIARRGHSERLDKLIEQIEEEEEEKVNALIAERDELRGDKKHWLRYVVTALVSLVAGALLLLLGRAVK